MAFNYEFPYTDPNFYNDDWLLSKMKSLLEEMASIEEWKEEYQSAYDDLKQIYDDIIKGNFPDSLVNAFNEWMKNNALDIVGGMIKQVYFELTDDGYFVAYIPDSWSDITFNTTYYDIILTAHPEVDFGHLVLTY